MREQLEKRREELTAELKTGQEMLAELDTKRSELQQTMLRIDGALQVLTELIEADGEPAGAARPNGVGQPGAVESLEPSLAG